MAAKRPDPPGKSSETDPDKGWEDVSDDEAPTRSRSRGEILEELEPDEMELDEVEPDEVVAEEEEAKQPPTPDLKKLEPPPTPDLKKLEPPPTPDLKKLEPPAPLDPRPSKPPTAPTTTLVMGSIGQIPAHEHPLVAELMRRAEAEEGDGISKSRAQTELAIGLVLMVGDRPAALTQFRAAHESAPMALMPLMGARWLTPSRPFAPVLALAEGQLKAAKNDVSRAERLVDLARLHQAAGAEEKARGLYRQALAIRPTHPGALRGLEGLLRTMMRRGAAETIDALSGHLEQMATAWAEETRLAAWLHVERAQLLDRLERTQAAQAAFQQAVELDGTAPHIRGAFTRHLLVHRATDILVEVWSSQSRTEEDPVRAARLAYAAGRLASERLEDANLGIDLHTRAAERSENDLETRRAALRELVRINESIGNVRAAADARKRALALQEDSDLRAHEHRRLAQRLEVLDHHEEVVKHAEQVLLHDPEDRETRERLDRALEKLGQHEKRISTWTAEASRVSEPPIRAEAFIHAAQIAELDLKNADLAVSMYRAAWAADSTSVDAFDGLARLLTPSHDEKGVGVGNARARIDLYEQAAQTAGDTERKISCYEKVAQIWEEELGRYDLALEVFWKIAGLAPKRRGAVLGIQRNASRSGDPGEYVRALSVEAELADNPILQRTLLLRAAQVAAETLNDADMAGEFIGRILSRTPTDAVALRAAWRISARCGRFEEGLTHLNKLLQLSRRGPAAMALSIDKAVLLEERLRRPADAVQAYREANELDPANPLPRVEMTRLMLQMGQFRVAADGLASIALRVSDPPSRARLLLEAAEIYDDRLDDLDRAIATLSQAQGVSSDDYIFERFVRVHERRNKPGDLIALLDKKLASDDTGPQAKAFRFELAMLLAGERDQVRASALLNEIVADQPGHVAAQRLLERALRGLDQSDELAALLRRQANTFTSLGAKLGALHEGRYLEEHGDATNPDGPLATLQMIRDLVPEDPDVHEALARMSGLQVTSPEVAFTLGSSLAVMASANLDDAHFAAGLALMAALLFDRAAQNQPQPALQHALQHYRACLSRWPTCLTAARGLRSVAERMSDNGARVEADIALGRLENEPSVRAEHCCAAAEAIAQSGSTGLAHATDLFSKALDGFPESTRAAQGIVGLQVLGAEPGRLADILRTALDQTSASNQIVLLGNALADIARKHLKDATVALEALKRVRDKAPGHVPTLLALADVYLELHMWAEAGEAAKSGLAITHDAKERLGAMLSLAESDAHLQARWGFAKGEAVEVEVAAEGLPPEERRLVLLRLAEVYRLIGDVPEAERLQCMSVALAGENEEALKTLSTMFRADSLEGAIGYVQALNRVLAMSDALGVPQQPLWLTEIGRLESTILSRPREGVARLREAIRLEPKRLESYVVLADTLAYLGAHEEAATELRLVLTTIPAPELTTDHVVTAMSRMKREYDAIGRTSQALAAEEIAAYLGYGAPERIATLRSRPIPDSVPAIGALDRSVLDRAVVPPAGQGVLRRLSILLEDIMPKLIRVDPTMHGAQPRERITARTAHPVRAMADRFAHAFGSILYDLYVDVPGLVAPRVVPGDPPAILLPTGFEKLPASEFAVGIVRLQTLVALGLAWLDEFSTDDLEGLFFGSLHVARAGWDAGALSASSDAMAEVWRPRIAKAASRRLKKELNAVVEEATLEMNPEEWRSAIRLGAWRCAYLVTGDLMATFNHVWRNDPDLARKASSRLPSALFEHVVLKDLILFGLSPESTGLRRAIGHRE